GMIRLFMGDVVDARALTERAFEAFSASSEAEKLAARAAGQDAGAAGLGPLSFGPFVLRPHYMSPARVSAAPHPAAGPPHRPPAHTGLRLFLCVHSSRSARRAGDSVPPRRPLPHLIGGTRVPSLARPIACHSGHLHDHA